MVLRKQDATHQDVTFDVIRIFLQHFFCQSLGFSDRRGRLFAAHQIVVTQLYPHVEVVRIQLDYLPHFFECFLVTLQAFVGVRQSPVRFGELIVDLQSVPEFKRRFLKLFIFQ